MLSHISTKQNYKSHIIAISNLIYKINRKLIRTLTHSNEWVTHTHTHARTFLYWENKPETVYYSGH